MILELWEQPLGGLLAPQTDFSCLWNCASTKNSSELHKHKMKWLFLGLILRFLEDILRKQGSSQYQIGSTMRPIFLKWICFGLRHGIRKHFLHLDIPRQRGHTALGFSRIPLQGSTIFGAQINGPMFAFHTKRKSHLWGWSKWVLIEMED